MAGPVVRPDGTIDWSGVPTIAGIYGPATADQTTVRQPPAAQPDIPSSSGLTAPTVMDDAEVRRRVLAKLAAEAEQRGSGQYAYPEQEAIINAVPMGVDEQMQGAFDGRDQTERASSTAMLTAVARAYQNSRDQAEEARLAALLAQGSGGGGGGGGGKGSAAAGPTSFLVPQAPMPTSAQIAATLGAGLVSQAPKFPVAPTGVGLTGSGAGEAARNGHTPAVGPGRTTPPGPATVVAAKAPAVKKKLKPTGWY